MERINELLKDNEDMEYIYNNLEKEFMIYVLEDYVNIKMCCKEKTKKYFQSENGKKRNREAQKRYYYKKNNIYHEKYNPQGIKKKRKNARKE